MRFNRPFIIAIVSCIAGAVLSLVPDHSVQAVPVLPGHADGSPSPDRSVQLAQYNNRSNQPPADTTDEDPDELSPDRGHERGDRRISANGQDSGGQSLRIDRLENQIRSLTGQIEQLQFQVRRLEEARKAQETDAKSAAPQAPAISPAQPTVVPALPSATDPTTGKRRRGDAFDPLSTPNAPGVPKNLGTLGSAGSQQPMDLGALRPAPASPATATPLPAGEAKAGGLPASSPAGVAGVSDAASPPRQPAERDEYDQANAALTQGQYEVAEKGFTAFLTKHSKSKLAPDAVFNLGESYFQRNRYSDAARQYLRLSTSYPSSPKGADAYLRLGQSLIAIDAKEQACAAFAEVGRKYPGASATIRAADRESKRLQC